MARQLGLEPTRVNRLLKTLAHLGMARQDPDRKYLPGPAMHVLSALSLFGSGLIRRAIGPLESLVAEHPYREPLWAQLITAYYSCQRQADALDAFRRVKAILATRSSREAAAASV